MNPSSLFTPPRVTLAIALAGALAFTVLPVSPLPQGDYPTISVGAGLPGASAEIMAASVATPLERQLGHIAGGFGGAGVGRPGAEIIGASVATPLERQLGHIAGVSEMPSSSSLGSTGIT